MQERWEAIVSGESQGAGAALARAGLAACSVLYGAGLAANHWVYDAGLKPHTKPALPVISVGNLSLGGTGKTTTTSLIARMLRERVKPGIVLRGYRRPSAEGPLIVSDGEKIKAEYAEAGDEALMLARELPGCAVAVGKRRERVIEALERETGAQVVILDDGFQYFRMARSIDIVLLDAMAESHAWRLFPAGRLREPAANLRRADQIWITHVDLAPAERVAQLREIAQRNCPDAVVATTRHKSGALRPLKDGADVPGSLAGRRVVALSALGNPQAFEMSVEAMGAQVTPLRFPDHHAYEAGDYQQIIKAARAADAEYVVTTEKDAVKLPAPPDDCQGVLVLGCELEIIDGAEQVHNALFSALEETLG